MSFNDYPGRNLLVNTIQRENGSRKCNSSTTNYDPTWTYAMNKRKYQIGIREVEVKVKGKKIASTIRTLNMDVMLVIFIEKRVYPTPQGYLVTQIYNPLQI